jgi:hypothetical protein
VALFVMSVVASASVPSQVPLGGMVYSKASQNVMGNHKSSVYTTKAESENDWTSRVVIHQFITMDPPLDFAQKHSGQNSNIELIEGDKDNIIQKIDTMNTVNWGNTVIYEQSVWRIKQLSGGKGLIAVQYSLRKVMPNNAPTGDYGLGSISQTVINELKTLPIESYQF